MVENRMMIKTFENIISPQHQDDIERFMLGWSFPWFHYANTNYSDLETRDDDVPQFTHGFFRDGQVNSKFMKIPQLITNAFNIPQEKVLRAKANLLMRQATACVHPKHIDDANPHYAFIYYVNNSDGDTHFYDGDDIIKQVSPKKGMGVLFDGQIEHSSSSPMKSHQRIVINFNFSPGDHINFD